MAPISYITRTQSFSAAHRLHSKQLSNEENQLLYGKCNHPNFHGHNYKVEITLRGEVNPITGMVMNLVDLKECIKLAIMDPLDHKNLDLDVEFFHKRPSTAENLAIFIWWNFQYHFLKNDAWRSSSAKLYKVKLYETEHNVIEYMGEGDLDGEAQLDVTAIKLSGIGINSEDPWSLKI
ncbi:hypothetical protein G6F70_001534 [Rhizopus microsporus]|uniref:6-pyruvoyl tetrahydrobiopterin synthase n=2 Tax=Rhizopus TaxID=4842 RepID=A0A367KAG8_RHIAZ|nr:hypothetical protein G6F71_007093 [Rhizopus microsporus]RCH86658.1 hypothetical protein CU097_002732 [Rhizopus azygosporus]KAG1203310.1 hypothetical protein G6F70_001534 [Rhizopus microsporus]KAG1208599.1 hypothetical protein G6F69_007073 [Rhizopus microsporus]KAG1226885.1 hypothetical protein G6F67_008765 [Rhizopus microsporus]